MKSEIKKKVFPPSNLKIGPLPLVSGSLEEKNFTKKGWEGFFGHLVGTLTFGSCPKPLEGEKNPSPTSF